MGRLVIDRFLEGYAVVETESGEMIDIEVSRLPEGVKEGTVLLEDGDGVLIVKDDAEEAERRARIREKMRRLWRRL